jgi:hypothetical protein
MSRSSYKNIQGMLERALKGMEEAEEGSEEWLFHKGNKLCFETQLQGVPTAATRQLAAAVTALAGVHAGF